MNALKKYILHFNLGKYLAFQRRIWRQHREQKKYDDITAITMKYKTATGRNLNLIEPKRFTEQLQWLKLFYRNDLMPICADKANLHTYMKNIGYEYLLNDEIGCWDKVEDIPWDKLPMEYMLKATHGSSMHIIKTKFIKVNKYIWKLILNKWLQMNISIEGREWVYNEIKPRIRVERIIKTGDKYGGIDYKFFCFNGQPKFVQVDTDLLSNHRIDFFSLPWEHLACRGQYLNSDIEPVCPEELDEMIKISQNISKPFPHVRVDFLKADRLYISELTFFDGSGFYNFIPDEYDFIFGRELTLPAPNYNLDIYNQICMNK